MNLLKEVDELENRLEDLDSELHKQKDGEKYNYKIPSKNLLKLSKGDFNYDNFFSTKLNRFI